MAALNQLIFTIMKHILLSLHSTYGIIFWGVVMKNVLGVLFVGLVSISTARADLNCVSTVDSNVSLKVNFTPVTGTRIYQVEVDAKLTNHNDIKEFTGTHQPVIFDESSITTYHLTDKDSAPAELIVSTIMRPSPGRGRVVFPTIVKTYAKLKLKDEALDFKCN